MPEIHAEVPMPKPIDNRVGKQQPKKCQACGGSGICPRCNGSKVDPEFTPDDDEDDEDCFECDGTGDCDECQPDSATGVEMTPAEMRLRDAVSILTLKGPMRASDLGWELWGETTESPGRGIGSHGHNKFCRSAGKLLRELERRSKARRTFEPGCILWHAI